VTRNLLDELVRVQALHLLLGPEHGRVGGAGVHVPELVGALARVEREFVRDPVVLDRRGVDGLAAAVHRLGGAPVEGDPVQHRADERAVARLDHQRHVPHAGLVVAGRDIALQRAAGDQVGGLLLERARIEVGAGARRDRLRVLVLRRDQQLVEDVEPQHPGDHYQEHPESEEGRTPQPPHVVSLFRRVDERQPARRPRRLLRDRRPSLRDRLREATSGRR